MRLREKLKGVEQKGISSMRRGLGRARSEWADVERRIRRHMRIYPIKMRESMKVSKEDECDMERMDLRLPTGGRTAAKISGAQCQPVVPIHRQDEDESEIEYPIAS